MTIKIEVAKLKNQVSAERIESAVWSLLEQKKIINNSIHVLPSSTQAELNEFSNELFSITFNEIPEHVEKSMLKFIYFEYELVDPETEAIESNDEQVPASTHWILPNKSESLVGLWESLIYDDNLKENLLLYAETLLRYSQKKINQNIVSCNRLILLHGPAGTGKTSLAKALAQKLSIHMSATYQYTHLFEINSHSLFSKWFSESGKMVMKMFEQIHEVLEMDKNLVCVLIDEVESIAYARGNISANEPSDSIRVVNAVLTQLDKIRRYPNVLIITTSNLTSNLDLAFLDRSDIVQFIGEPSKAAVYKIIRSTIQELADKGIIVADSLDDGRDDFNIQTIASIENFSELKNFKAFSNANICQQICIEATGFSGRTLRKLPFLASALFVKKDSSTLREFLIALRSAVDFQKRSKQKISNHNQIADPYKD